MLMTAERERTVLALEDPDRVRALYEEGQCLRAYELARTVGPLDSWGGTAARLMASGLAANLGAPRLGTAPHVHAYRDDPTDPEACFYFTLARLSRRGPLRTWDFLKTVGPLPEATDRTRGFWLSMHAIVLGHLRDFDAAESWLARAEAVAPEQVWLLVQRSNLFEMDDRYDEALASSREAPARRPWYRPAVQQVVHFLQLLDRDEEAVALLTEAVERIESAAVVAQLGVLQAEMKRHADARRTWERFVATAPLLDKPTWKWLAGRRSDAAYECGEIAEAAALARECGEPFFLALAPGWRRLTPMSTASCSTSASSASITRPAPRQRSRRSPGSGISPANTWKSPRRSATTADPTIASAPGPSGMAGFPGSSR